MCSTADLDAAWKIKKNTRETSNLKTWITDMGNNSVDHRGKKSYAQ